MKLKNCNGSIIVEAAIFLPVLLIAIISMIFIMKLYLVEDSMQHLLTDEVGRIAEEAYLEDKVYSNETIKRLEIHGFMKVRSQDDLTAKMHSRIAEQLDGWNLSENPKIIRYKYLFDGRYEDVSDIHAIFINSNDLIEVATLCKVEMPFPIGVLNEINLIQSVIKRGWTGTEHAENKMNFSEMEQPFSGKVVYVFPDY